MTTISKLDELYKFGTAEPNQRPSKTGRVFSSDFKNGATQLSIMASIDQVALLATLLAKMPEPFWLLYVLVVPRGEGREGRYQSSEPMTLEEVIAFLMRFKHFFERDGRHNLWFKSQSGPALLVWDRHNLIYGYGLTNEWIDTLLQLGWEEVEKSVMELPDPHAHHYHAIFDDDARNVLAAMEWNFSLLREQDQ